jgi:L-ascorbate metabolism protein UlaG (beta-lactamase superfamily)
MPEATGQIETSIQKLGFKITDIRYILNTHAHLDHTGGFAQIKKESGAQMIAGEKDKQLLEGGYYPGQEDEDLLKFPPVKVDRVVHEGDTVRSAASRRPHTRRRDTRPAAQAGPWTRGKVTQREACSSSAAPACRRTGWREKG